MNGLKLQHHVKKKIFSVGACAVPYGFVFNHQNPYSNGLRKLLRFLQATI